ncbi:hypothetical protein [Gordonia paraffinivorans]|uniref:hypothetical protein n=1 Tax=Gordonia paraffinivorans TaxID=175628 RepID=UPI00144804E8|nr:hypothetical protein [Gordonia paraffinivorans]
MRVEGGRRAARERLVANTRTTQAGIAIGSVGVGYLAVFGPETLESVRYAAPAGVVHEIGTSLASSVAGLVWTITVALCVVAALRFRRPWWPSPGRWPWSSARVPVETVLGGAGIVALAFFLEGVVTIPMFNRLGLLNWFETPEATATTDWLDAVSAGIGEEILVVAAPVTVLRFYRVSGRFAVPVLVAARMAYHLYYGHAGVWWLAPWALATAIVYWRWPDVRLLVALMVLDVVWNAQGVLFGDDLLTDLVLIGVGLALLAVAFAIDLRWYRNPTPPMTPTTSLRTVWLRAHGTSPGRPPRHCAATPSRPLTSGGERWPPGTDIRGRSPI